jgi:hypothetical protein
MEPPCGIAERCCSAIGDLYRPPMAHHFGLEGHRLFRTAQ